MRRTLAILTSISGSVLMACRGPERPSDLGTFEPPRDLTATLVDGQHVDLAWRHDATAPGGAFVEFKMGADDDRFTLLDAVWTGTTGFRHPDVAPDTEFLYRVRSFFGRPSEVAAVQTGRKGAADKEHLEGRLDGAGEVIVDEPGKVRSGFAPHAAPSHFTVMPASGTSVELRWRDNARDEDGYLVELSMQPDRDYRIAALLPPDSTSFRKISLEEESRFYFRVRPFFYGPSSNLVSVQTPTAAVQRTLKSIIEGPSRGGGG